MESFQKERWQLILTESTNPIKKVIALLVIVAIIVALLYNAPKLAVVSGFVAKKACSCLNVGKQDLETIKARDFGSLPLSLATLEVSSDGQAIEASVFGLYKRKAIHRPGLGCALLQGEDKYKIARIKTEVGQNSKKPEEVSDNETGPLHNSLDTAFEIAFDKGDAWEKKTSALLVMHKGQIIREQYADGYDHTTKFLGWSMAKSVCNLLVGLLVKDKTLSLEQDKLYPAWENDERKSIKLKNLLKMNSGLEWIEQYGTVSDVTQGLFSEEDFVRFTFQKKQEDPIGEKWKYASGTTNLISGIIKREFEEYQSYLNYPETALFSKLNLDSPIMETDEAGNYIMSSFLWASARDWATLGQLYLNNGEWNGEQLISKEYMEWSLQPAADSKGYGAQIWLNMDKQKFPDAPEELYWFGGYNGQYVLMVPSKELVVVRLGQNKEAPFDMQAVLSEVLRRF